MNKIRLFTTLIFLILPIIISLVITEAPIASAANFFSAEDVAEQIQKAQKLSYEAGRLADAIAAYRKAVNMDASHWEARLGLARVLSWDGRNEEAIELYDALIEERSDNAEALLGRAQIARWTGKYGMARWLLQHAINKNPSDYRLFAEKAQLDIATKRFNAALKAIDICREMSPDAFETKEAIKSYNDATESRFHIKTTMSEESTSEESTKFRRLTQIVRHEAFLFPDLKIQLEALYTQFSDPNDDELDRLSLGVSMKQYLPWGLSADIHYRNNRIVDDKDDINPTNEVAFQIGGRPFYGPIESLIGVRRRAIVDLPVGYKDIAYMEEISSGGTTIESIRERLQIRDEIYAEAAFAPFTFLYVYGNGSWGEVEGDESKRRSIAAGTGLNLIDLFGIQSIHTLTLKFDYYYLSFSGKEKPEYYSPTKEDPLRVYTPGIAWRMAPSRDTIVGFDAGYSKSEDDTKNEDDTGYIAEGYFLFSITDQIQINCRMKISDNTAYKIKSGAAGLVFRF